MKKRIILVQPNYSIQRKTKYWGIDPPLGLCYIASTLKEHGISVKILDANASFLSVEDVFDKVKDYRLIGISVMTPGTIFVFKLIKKVKSYWKRRGIDGKIICGGAHSSGDPNEMLENGCDIVVRGEGEKKMLEICQGKPLKDIEGISYAEQGFNHNKDAKDMEPDSIPFPDRDLIENAGTRFPYLSTAVVSYPWGAIFTSRGCPYQCYFCNKQVFGSRYRTRSPENVVEEIEMLIRKYKVREIDIFDDSFNIDLPRAKRILDLIIGKRLKIWLRFPNGIRANHVDEELMVKLKKAGCIYVAYGAESGNKDVLAKIPKGETLEEIEYAVNLSKKYGIPTGVFFIFGLMGDTKETMQETLDFAKRLNPDIGIFNLLVPYKGTRIYSKILDGGEFLVAREDMYHTSGKPIFSHKDFPDYKDVIEIFNKAYKEFYLSPRYMINNAKTTIRMIFRMRSLDYVMLNIRGLYKIMESYGR